MDLYMTGQIHRTACMRFGTAPAATFSFALCTMCCSQILHHNATFTQNAASCVVTNMPDCVGEHNNKKAPYGWMHNEAKDEQLVDTRPAGHKPEGKQIPQAQPNASVADKATPCSISTSKQGLIFNWQQMDSTLPRKGCIVLRRH